MRKLFFSLVTLIAMNELQAQRYYTGFETSNEQQGWTIFRKGSVNQFNNWALETGGFESTKCFSHNYPVGGQTVTDDWLVSPSLSIQSGGKIDSLRFRCSGFSTPATGDTIAIYLLSGSADPSLATSKQLILDFRADNYVNDNTWRKFQNIQLPNQGAVSYLAFRYKTIVSWLDVKIDNISISATSTTSIEENNTASILGIKVFPNPFEESATVIVGTEALEHFTVKVYNLAGQLLQSQSYENTNQATLYRNNLKQGIYIYQIEQKGTILNTGKVIVK